jgi:hypothetical protein
MQSKQSIISLLVTAALALPCVVYAASVPGSTDEARALTAQQDDQSHSYQNVDRAALARAGSTDQARGIAGKRQAEQEPNTLSSACMQPAPMGRPSSTDEARAAAGRAIDAREACAQHA